MLVFPTACLVPESPRYLISKGRVSEARDILAKYHAGGDHNSALVNFEIIEIERAIEADQAAFAGSSWKDLFSTKWNRHRAFITSTIGVFAQWNGVGVVSYYLALVLQTVGITPVTHQTLISGCLQVWNLFFAMGAVASVDHLGRRMLFLISAWGMLVSFIIISGLSGGFATTGTAAICIAVIPFLYIYYAFYDIALICHIAEIWPYQLRARGMALGQMSTYFAIFFNVFVNPIVLEAIAWKYYLIYVAILIIFVLNIYFCYPETKGYTLEEMAVIFDGQQGPAILEGVATKAKAKAVEAQLDEVP